MLTPTPHILFELDFDVKLPLLRLLLFISDLKSTILLHNSPKRFYTRGPLRSVRISQLANIPTLYCDWLIFLS